MIGAIFWWYIFVSIISHDTQHETVKRSSLSPLILLIMTRCSRFFLDPKSRSQTGLNGTPLCLLICIKFVMLCNGYGPTHCWFLIWFYAIHNIVPVTGISRPAIFHHLGVFIIKLMLRYHVSIDYQHSGSKNAVLNRVWIHGHMLEFLK